MTERIRFYTDEHVSKAVINGLRQRGIDVLTVPEADKMGASDREHLDFAIKEGRIIFTQDTDFLRLHSTGLPHPGIIYSPLDSSIGDIIRGLVLIHEILSPPEMKNHVEFI